MEPKSLHDSILLSQEFLCEHVAKGFRAALYFWQLVDPGTFKEWSSAVPEVELTDDELRDNPFFPDIPLANEAEVRSRETDFTENGDYEDLSVQRTELGGLECPLNAREIRIELALRLRAKIGDYAGRWWPKSAAMWCGYLLALYSQDVLNKRDTDYLFRFLPGSFEKWIDKVEHF